MDLFFLEFELFLTDLFFLKEFQLMAFAFDDIFLFFIFIIRPRYQLVFGVDRY